jgi:hypothetical protein
MPHASCTPLAVKHAAAGSSHLPPSTDGASELLWDPQFDTPGPAYDLLVGGMFYFPGLELASAAMFWCSEVVCVEGNYLAAKQHLQLTQTMLSNVLMCCIAPSTDSSQSKCVQFLHPLVLSADSGVTRPADEATSHGEGSFSGKGKGQAVVPMDKDEPEWPTSPLDGSNGDSWDKILG